MRKQTAEQLYNSPPQSAANQAVAVDNSESMKQINATMTELCSGINALGQQLQLGLQMSRTDRQKNLVIILFSHTLDVFQDMLACMEDKPVDNIRNQVVSLLDASVATSAACRKRQLVDDFYESGNRQRIYHRKAYQSLPRNVSAKISMLSGRYFAEMGGLIDYYSELRRQTGIEQVHLPECSQLSVVSCECMFLAIRSVSDFFRIRDLEKEYYLYWDQYMQIVRKAPE